MRKYSIIILLIAALCSCNNKQQKDMAQEEDLQAKKSLQGVWVDDESDMVLFKVDGDTIYYPDVQNAPVHFKIIKDSLLMYGNEISRYKIDKQEANTFWFHSLSDNIVKLHRSDDEEDWMLSQQDTVEAIPTYTEVIKKDSVIWYDRVRYRAYVFINPSHIKVLKTSYTEDGISMDNVYYDNVIHICVYEGSKCIYASDITKQKFTGLIPDDFLQKAIFSDMDFIGVNSSGFHYQGTVRIPESSVCYLVNLNISFKGKLSMKAQQ